MLLTNIASFCWFAILVVVTVRIINGIVSKEIESLQFLNAIIENIPIIVFLKDVKELRFVRMNKAGQELIGITQKEIEGKNDYDFFPKEQADFFTSMDREVLNGGVLKDIPAEPISTKEHGIRFLHTKKVPIFNKSGKPTHLLGISEDITNLKNLIEEKQTQQIKTELAYKELEQFSFSVSHDLKSPLSRVKAFIEMIKQEPQNTMQYIARIEAAHAKMTSTIEDLLKLSRVGDPVLTKTAVNVTNLCNTIVSELKEREPNRVIKVDVANDITITADEKLTRILLENLLSNAWKFTSKAKNAAITVGVDGDNVFIKDNGAGFDMRYAGKLFKPFQRLHTESEFPGTGIGLSIVKRVVDRHNGTIEVKSTLNRGTTFTFKL